MNSKKLNNMANLQVTQEFIQTEDKTKINTIYLASNDSNPNATTILWVHGFADHCYRYVDIMQFFSNQGFNSIAFDLRGHGDSSGTRAFVKNFEDYHIDLNSVYNHFASKIKGKLILVGHSMGGLVVISHRLFNNKFTPDITIVSSPFLGVAIPVPAYKKLLSKIVVGIYPKLSIPSGLDPKYISHDSDIVKKYIEDPKVFKIATAGWFETTMDQIDKVFTNAKKLKGPFHILMAGDDHLVDPKATQKFFALTDQSDKSLTVFEGFYHEIFNEVKKQDAYDNLLSLIK